MIVGSTFGGFIPYLWDQNGFDLTFVLLGTAGGFLGIYCGFKLAKYFGMD